MGVGRFACVALPFGLTVASLICILVAMLAGITTHDLSMFDIDTKNLTISASTIKNLEDLVKRAPIPEDHFSGLTIAAQGPSSTIEEFLNGKDNITAKELGLADSYKVSLWNYCGTYSDGKTNCTKGKFDWASSATNVTALEATANALSGSNITLPKEMKSALHTYSTVNKWTEVVYIIAILLAAAELILGVFAICSRVGSCITWLISGLATGAIIVASIMATAESSIVVGALKSSAKSYGVNAHLNSSFLATTWLAVAFSVAAGLFWSFSMCCCAADHHKSNRKSVGDHEKLIPTGQYQRVGEYNNGQQRTGVFNTGGMPAPQRGHNGAYEPYSHTTI